MRCGLPLKLNVWLRNPYKIGSPTNLTHKQSCGITRRTNTNQTTAQRMPFKNKSRKIPDTVLLVENTQVMPVDTNTHRYTLNSRFYVRSLNADDRKSKTP